MKIKENYGAKAYELEYGYCDTGYIPETGNNLGKLKEMETKEKMMEKHERKMHEMMGMDPEYDGGFLERRNTDDRM